MKIGKRKNKSIADHEKSIPREDRMDATELRAQRSEAKALIEEHFQSAVPGPVVQMFKLCPANITRYFFQSTSQCSGSHEEPRVRATLRSQAMRLKEEMTNIDNGKNHGSKNC